MNSHFIGHPELTQCADGRNFRVVSPFGFWTPRTGLVSVPKGFITDLASIPRVFWNLLPPFGKYTNAAIVHDYLYRTHLCSRAMADYVIWQGMRASRVGFAVRLLIWGNVRLFGWIAWRDDARRIIPHHTEVFTRHA